jgi:hypothetical protein
VILDTHRGDLGEISSSSYGLSLFLSELGLIMMRARDLH